jgi:hypothetical protein
MHPQLLHQLADDTIMERRRHLQSHGHGPRRHGEGARPASRLRVRAGRLLIAVGIRLAGTRSGPAVLHHQSSAPS